MLTENLTSLSDSRCHIMVDRWKGMSQDQLNDIRQQQLIQIAERQVHTFPYGLSCCFSYLISFSFKKMKHIEKSFDETWKKYADAVAKQAILVEQQIEQDKRKYNHYLSNENKNLAKIQHERQDYLNSVVYRSSPTADFYQQFNTTSR